MPFPPTWQVEAAGAWVRATPPFALVPVTVFEVGPLLPRREVSAEAALAAGLATDHAVVRAPVETAATTIGWPFAVHRGTVRDAAGSFVEARIVVRYEMLVVAGLVVVRSTVENALDQYRAELRELLVNVRPNFETDEPAAIAELWDMR